MNEFKDRLKQARKAANKTQAEVAKAVNMTQPSYHQLESGKSTASTFLPLIADFLNVSPLWLQTGSDKFLNTQENKAIYNVAPVDNELLEKRPEVPLLTWVSAGAWLQNHGSFTVTDAVRWLPCPTAHSKMTFALKVEGDSMTSPYPNDKSYPHGTLIYVDPEQQAYSGCRVVAFLANEQAYTFKRYIEDMGKRYLKPINPSYESILITDDVEIVGVVIGNGSTSYPCTGMECLQAGAATDWKLNFTMRIDAKDNKFRTTFSNLSIYKPSSYNQYSGFNKGGDDTYITQGSMPAIKAKLENYPSRIKDSLQKNNAKKDW